jgi:hypothetical protein
MSAYHGQIHMVVGETKGGTVMAAALTVQQRKRGQRD